MGFFSGVWINEGESILPQFKVMADSPNAMNQGYPAIFGTKMMDPVQKLYG